MLRQHDSLQIAAAQNGELQFREYERGLHWFASSEALDQRLNASLQLCQITSFVEWN